MKPTVKTLRPRGHAGASADENALAPRCSDGRGEARDASNARRQRAPTASDVRGKSLKVGQEVFKVIEAMAREVRSTSTGRYEAAISKVGDTKGYSVEISVPVEMIVFSKMPDGDPVEDDLPPHPRSHVAGKRYDGSCLSVSVVRGSRADANVRVDDIPALGKQARDRLHGDVG